MLNKSLLFGLFRFNYDSLFVLFNFNILFSLWFFIFSLFRCWGLHSSLFLLFFGFSIIIKFVSRDFFRIM